ncbi:MAG: type II secretion system protein [Puniceicoccaceae bacterium]
MNSSRINKIRGRGFTLVEILAAVAVIGILSGILVAGVGRARQAAETSAATSSARSLIQAYLMTPMENGGEFAIGYGNAGETLYPRASPPLSPSSEEAKRYPWRIAPFLDDGVKALYVGAHREYYDRVASKNAYMASLYPSFGINSIFVGGHYDGRKHSPGYTPGGRSNDQSTFPRDFWVLRPGDAHDPSRLIVFASAISPSPPDYPEKVGFHRVLPPDSPLTADWGSYNPEIPASLGHVSLEYGGKAVVAHLDGSVGTATEEELRDMRRWSNQAALFDDPGFSDWNRER